MPSSLSIKIGGEAGQGVQSVSAMLARILQRLGLHVFAYQDKESRIRGGHNFVHMAAGQQPLYAPRKQLDMLICLDRPSVEIHAGEVNETGLVLFDEDMVKDAPGGEKFFGLRLGDIAKETAGSAIMANSVAVGAALAWAQIPFDVFVEQLKSYFAAKGDEIVTRNVTAARAGFERAAGYLKRYFDLELPVQKPDTILIQGAQAMALGAIAAGCSFISSYPMSPATAILEYFFRRRDDLGLVAVQAEDEIAAINMAIGASYAGVRAMTSTSGGGFSLMVEGLGLAGITETPVVIVNAQRPGPSTGLPTRTEQGDLEFITYASQGEFPRAVLTPGTAGQAFRAMVRAFNLAEKYHVPVIVLADQYMCDSIWTEQPFNLNAVEIDRGPLYVADESSDARDYRRYKLGAGDGVSPRAFPGDPKAFVRADSDEHDEQGLITENATVRKSQTDKRMRKFEALRNDIVLPALYGPEEYDELVVCWGTTLGAALPAVEEYRALGASCSLLHFEQTWPLAKDRLAEAMEHAKKNICIEMNATGQLAHLVQAETGLGFDRKILKYDGRPFLPEDLAAELGRES